MTLSISTNSNHVITSNKDLEELIKLYDSDIPKEVSKEILIYDSEKQEERKYYFDIEDAIDDAKETFINQELENSLPNQVNVDIFCVKKDGEDFYCYFVEFMNEESNFRIGMTYASNKEAQDIFNKNTVIDTTFLHDFDMEHEEI